MVAGEPIRAIDLLRDRLDHPGTAQAAGRARRPARDPRHPLAHARPAHRLHRPHRRGPVAHRRGGRRAPGAGARRPACRRSSTSARSSRPPSSATRCRCSPSGSASAARSPRCARSWRGSSRRRRTSTRSRRTCARSSPTSTADDPLLPARPAPARLDRAPPRRPARIARARTTAAPRWPGGCTASGRPWGQECRLLGGLTAYELGDWDGAARRLDLAGRPAPQPGARHLHGGRSASCRPVGASPSTPPSSPTLRQWWHVDGALRRADDHARSRRARSGGRPRARCST